VLIQTVMSSRWPPQYRGEFKTLNHLLFPFHFFLCIPLTPILPQINALDLTGLEDCYPKKSPPTINNQLGPYPFHDFSLSSCFFLHWCLAFFHLWPSLCRIICRFPIRYFHHPLSFCPPPSPHSPLITCQHGNCFFPPEWKA